MDYKEKCVEVEIGKAENEITDIFLIYICSWINAATKIFLQGMKDIR